MHPAPKTRNDTAYITQSEPEKWRHLGIVSWSFLISAPEQKERVHFQQSFL